MYSDFCNGNLTAKCNESARPVVDEDWPLERVVSMVVPVFFGLIGLCGLLGNVLVVVGKLYITNTDFALAFSFNKPVAHALAFVIFSYTK